MRTPSKHEEALLKFLVCDQSELKKISNTVYQWRGQYLEILTYKQMLNSKTPAPWYMKIEGWRIREMGKQSAKVKKIKQKYA